MPRIPLYQSQSRIGTAQGVKINTSVVNRLMDAQAAESQSIISGVADVMQETLNAGQEYLDKRKENKIKADKNLMQLAEIDVDIAIQKKRNELIDQGKDESYIFNEIVNNDFANNWLQEYIKDNKIEMTDDLQQTWDLKTKSIEKSEYLKYATFEEQRNIQADNMFVGRLINEGKIEEAISYAKDNIVDASKRQELLSGGMYSRYQKDIMLAQSNEELDKIQKEYTGYATQQEPLLMPDGFESLNVQLEAARVNISKNIHSPAIKEARELSNNNEFSINSDTFRRLPPEEQALYLKRREQAIQTVKIETFDPETQNNLIDEASQMVGRFMSGRYSQEELDAGINTPREMLEEIYNLVTSRKPDKKGKEDPTGEFIIPEFLQDEILAPILWARGDSDTVKSFMPEAKFLENREGMFVQSSYEMFFDAYQSAASNLIPSERINLGFKGLQVIQNTIENILKDPSKFEGVEVKLVNGKRYVTGYEKHMEEAINNVLVPLRTTVANERLKNFFMPDLMYEVARNINQDNQFKLQLSDEQIAKNAIAPTIDNLEDDNEEPVVDVEEQLTDAQKRAKLRQQFRDKPKEEPKEQKKPTRYKQKTTEKRDKTLADAKQNIVDRRAGSLITRQFRGTF